MIVIIFLIGLIIRFLFFPNNIYFGFDQARDAYSALEIWQRNLKIIGPTTAFEGLHHGVLYYYIIAPFYGLWNMNPEVVAAVLRILNALGVFLIFLIAKTLFDKKVGLIAALLFTFSFEQSQFSLYMGNPTLASLSVLIFYLGLALVIFEKKNFGLPLALLGLGASIQFQFALMYLVVPLILILIIYRKSFLKLPLKTWGISLLTLLISLSTFLIAELKYNSPTYHGLLQLATNSSEKNVMQIIGTYYFTVSRMVTYNLTGNWPIATAVLLILGVSLIWFIKKNIQKGLFLSIWFFSIFLTIVVNGGVKNPYQSLPLYYPNVGVSLSLLIFTAFLITKIFVRDRILGLTLVILILFANLSLIKSFNPKGNFSEISVQQGMLLGDEKKVLDYIYDKVDGQPFAVKAVTMPLFVNTTWSYLFFWYGEEKYGYMPVWNGKNAEGYFNSLTVDEKHETIPEKRFLILEPTIGIAPYLIDGYLKEENYFTKVIEEKSIGSFIIQTREKI